MAGASALFVAGVAFGYFVVLPVALEFLLDFGGDTFQTQVRAGEYFGFVTTLMLGSGLMFEVPVAMLALARIGVTSSAAFYVRHWRIAIVRDRRAGGDPAGRRPVQHAAADDPADRALRRSGSSSPPRFGQSAAVGPGGLGRATTTTSDGAPRLASRRLSRAGGGR